MELKYFAYGYTKNDITYRMLRSDSAIDLSLVVGIMAGSSVIMHSNIQTQLD